MALIIGQFSFLANNGDKIRAFAARYEFAIVYPTTGDARAGGLMSYWANLLLGIAKPVPCMSRGFLKVQSPMSFQ